MPHPLHGLATALALVIPMTGCGDGGGSGDDGGGAGDGAGDGENGVDAAATIVPDAFSSSLKRLEDASDAYRYIGKVTRIEFASSTGSIEDEPTSTRLTAKFNSTATSDGMRSHLAELAHEYERTVLADRCFVDGYYDGAVFDDAGRTASGPTTPSHTMSAGDELLVSDEIGTQGAFAYVTSSRGSYYSHSGPEREVAGSVYVEVPGDEFPGLGTLTLAPVTVEGVAVDRPADIEATVSWKADPRGGRVIVNVGTASGSDLISITCSTDDDGDFRVPDATLDRLPESLRQVDGWHVTRRRNEAVGTGDAVTITESVATHLVSADPRQGGTAW